MAVLADLNKLFSTLTVASQTQAVFGKSFAKSFESIKDSVKTLNLAMGPSSFLATVKDLASKKPEERIPTFVGGLLKQVKEETQQLQKGLDTFSSSIITRSELMAATLEAAFKGGGPVGTAVKTMETLGRLDFSRTMSGLVEGAKYATKLSEALGTSAENSAQLVFYAKQGGVPLKEMGDTLATIRENTRLTADEFGRFSTELSQALMTLGSIKDVSMVLKESLRIDDALRKFTGSSGDYVKFFQHIAQSTEGMQTAMAFGFSPESLGQEGNQRQFIQNLGQFVDRLTRGQPLLQQLAVLEQLSQQTGLSVVSLRNLGKAVQELKDTTDRQITLDERYAEQIANLGKSTQSIRESFNQLISATMLPLVTITNYAAKGLAYILEQLREFPGVFTTLATVGLIPAAMAVKGFLSVIWQIVKSAPPVITALLSFNKAIQQVGVSAAVSSMAMRGPGGGGMMTGSFQRTVQPGGVPSLVLQGAAAQAATQATTSVFQKFVAPLFGKLTASSLSSSISAAYLVETLKGGFTFGGTGMMQGLKTLFMSGTSLIGSSLVSVIVNPLKLLFTSIWGPVSRALLWLASPVGIAGLAVAAAAATAGFIIKKDIDLIRETRQIEAYNRESGLRMTQELRKDLVERASRARKAEVKEGVTDEDTLKSINITQRKVVGGQMFEQSYNLAKLMETQRQELEILKRGTAEEGALTDVQAAQAGKELEERYAVLLRNAVASTQNLILTESRPASESEQKQLELLERMVKHLEKQISQKDREIEDAKKQEEEKKEAERREAVRQQSFRGVGRTGY